MNVGGRPMRTIWLAADRRRVEIIDQTRLPHELVIATLATIDDAARAIRTMQVRGAPLIGAAAAYGMALAMAADPCDAAARTCGGDARRDPPDRGQSALGARRDEVRVARGAAAAALCRRPGPRRRDRRGGCREQPRDRRARRAA